MSILVFLCDRPATTAAVVVLALAAVAVALPAAASEAAQRVDVVGARPGPAGVPAAGVDLRYDMEDGRALHVEPHGEVLAVRYGRRPERFLQHDGNGRFVSGDGRWSLRFDRDADGAPSVAHLTRPVIR